MGSLSASVLIWWPLLPFVTLTSCRLCWLYAHPFGVFIHGCHCMSTDSPYLLPWFYRVMVGELSLRSACVCQTPHVLHHCCSDFIEWGGEFWMWSINHFDWFLNPFISPSFVSLAIDAHSLASLQQFGFVCGWSSLTLSKAGFQCINHWVVRLTFIVIN